MLSEEEKLKFLKATDLFGHLTSEGLASICQIIQENDYPAGQVLFNEGDIGDSLYLVVDGEVGIIKDDIQVLALNETGTCIGEMALIDDEPRSATVKITKVY